MNAERYEYRIVDKDGLVPHGWPDTTWRGDPRETGVVAREDEQNPERAPHRVERRLLTEWEPVGVHPSFLGRETEG